MGKRVCPWWLGYLLASPLRRWISDDPYQLLRPYVREGMSVLEPGPGMGFFTIPLAELVGASGRVIAVDVQPKMIAGLKRKLQKKNLAERVDARVVLADSMNLVDLAGKADFILVFAMVHEMPSSANFFREAAQAARPGARLLLVEPAGHVKTQDFETELAEAAGVGLRVVARPTIRRSHAALLQKA